MVFFDATSSPLSITISARALARRLDSKLVSDGAEANGDPRSSEVPEGIDEELEDEEPSDELEGEKPREEA